METDPALTLRVPQDDRHIPETHFGKKARSNESRKTISVCFIRGCFEEGSLQADLKLKLVSL